MIRLDNGTEFDNQLVKSVAARYQVTLAFGAVRNPQSQSVVERGHGTLLGIIRSLMFGLGTGSHWSDHLHRALEIYRSRPHVSCNGYSPRELLFGYPPSMITSEFEQDAYQGQMFDEIDEQESRFEAYPSASSNAFAAGDRVLVRVDARRQQKLAYPWTPATVVKGVGRGSYVVRDSNGREATFNQKNLAQARVEVPFLPPQPRSSRVPQLGAQDVESHSTESQAPISLPELVLIEPQVTERRSARRPRPTRRLLTEI